MLAPRPNKYGDNPPIDAKGVVNDLNGNVDMILDGGRTTVGIESTIIDLTVFPCRLLREGAISKTQIKEAWKDELEEK